ncbi:hypothetical protein PT286_09850 [Neisseriaceae bacterium ESL0693]|nr:hypothetical protein [Neisseriaceae bacterium ESL0693]
MTGLQTRKHRSIVKQRRFVCPFNQSFNTGHAIERGGVILQLWGVGVNS